VEVTGRAWETERIGRQGATVNATITYHDPRGESETAPDPYELRVSLEGAISIGLVANGFPDSVRFLDHVEKALAQELPSVTFVRYDKGDASSVLSEAMLDDISAECQAVVAAYGH
jgi:hypothetical protein